MGRNRFRFLCGVLAVLAGVSLFHVLRSYPSPHPALATAGIFDKGTPDHLIGRITTIVDEQGNMLSMMARNAYAGDELYTCEGRIYRVARVEGDRAEAKFMGMDPQIIAYRELYAGQNVAVLKNEVAQQKQSSFAVYHTHSDESYVPSDGTESIPFKGGIYQVGKTMVDRLKGKGIQVNYDQTPHDPHDNNAYVRSRRTAANLMKTNPAAIFDIHRDGVPDPGYYRANINGEKVARLRLVVGRENPRMSANMDFARRMMTAANNMHANVVKEIFVGRGDYNQDLMPTALLIEAGTHTNTKEEAAKGVSFFTEAMPTALGIAPAPAAPTAPGVGVGGRPTGAAGGAWKALGWILGVTVVGGLGFLLISAGNLENFKKRLSGFGKEFTSYFGPRRALRKRLGKHDDKRGGNTPEVYNPNENEKLKDVRDELTKD